MLSLSKELFFFFCFWFIHFVLKFLAKMSLAPLENCSYKKVYRYFCQLVLLNISLLVDTANGS